MKEDWQKFRESFEKFIIRDLEKALNADVEVGTIIITVIGIECLSGYFAGRDSNGETFRNFIDEFMPAYSRHSKAICSCIRNGLAHNYIIKEVEGESFLFTRNRGEKHLIPVEDRLGWYYLNRESFALDFLKAQEKFFERVNDDEELCKKVIQRLDDKSFLDVFSFPPKTMFADPSRRKDEYDSATGVVIKKL